LSNDHAVSGYADFRGKWLIEAYGNIALISADVFR